MIDLIKSGDIERLLLVLFVFGTIAFRYVTGNPPDDRLIDFGLVILGYFFGSVIGSKMRANST